MDREITELSEDVEALFRSYDGTSNIRELKNVVDGAFNIASSKFVQPYTLPAYLT